MRRLEVRARAQRDLIDIAIFVGQQNGSRAAAERFANDILDFCERLSRNPAIIGSLQPEFGAEIRAWTRKGIIMLVRYTADAVIVITMFSAKRDRSGIVLGDDE